MTEDIADAAQRQGLGRAFRHAPDEVAAAVRLAAEQAAAMALLPSPLPAREGPGVDDQRSGFATRAAFGVGAPMSNPASPLWQRSIARITQGYRDRTLTPLALLESLLARIEAIDPHLDAFVALDPDTARNAARSSATRWATGRPLGPLDGIPVGIKDVIDVAGQPTRCHARTTSAAPAIHDAAIVAQLRAGGAIILGKLATHEYAIGGPAFDLPFPPARNPWNRDHHPGGSSSGAGAAVAAGLVPLAIGTDTAGSVRNPASACGIVGLKPGRGVLPLDGIVPLAWTLDHVGLLTRTVGDMQIAAHALGVGMRPAKDACRIGYVRHFHERDMPARADVTAALDHVAATLGAKDIALPPLDDFALVNRILLQSEGFALHGTNLRAQPEAFSALTRKALMPGAFTTAETLSLAHRHRLGLAQAVDAAFAHVDILLTASSMDPACRIDDPAEIARTYMRQARSPFNVTGHPALAMMAGLSEERLPISVQFVSRMGEEAALLAVAAQWERAMGNRGWPPL